MNHLELLAEAMEYMEQHLQEEIHTEDIAKACYCSKSTLEKLFRCVNHISVREYLVRRRMTRAARKLVECPELSVLEVALMFGYSSHEAFTRAFAQVWQSSPSKYRENDRTSELFPRLNPQQDEESAYLPYRRYFDISELYDLFRSRRDCYFVCCDINGLVPINEISLKAGDLAILETMRRMEEASREADILFRIGGDEFALLTASADKGYAEEIAKNILARNGECIVYQDRQIPLGLCVAVVKLCGKNLQQSELFTSLRSTLDGAKNI